MNSHGPLWMGAGLLGLSAVCLTLGMAVGSTGWENLGQAWNDEVTWRIIRDIRLPRTLGAWAAGALLGLAGALAQGLFRNPLADPYLLGSASGASLGVALFLSVFGGGMVSHEWLLRLGMTGAAFSGAVLAVMLTLVLARGVQHTLRLLLSGVVVGVVLGAMTSCLLQMQPNVLQVVQGFMLGSTAFVDWSSCLLMLSLAVVCTLCTWVFARVLDALSLGENTALSLGVPLASSRALLVGVLALATGTAVAQVGLIAFVGLSAPHLVRTSVQAQHRWTLALSALMGGVLLLSADVLARALLAPQEIPVGVLTALLGGSYLLWLMYQGRARGL